MHTMCAAHIKSFFSQNFPLLPLFSAVCCETALVPLPPRKIQWGIQELNVEKHTNAFLLAPKSDGLL